MENCTRSAVFLPGKPLDYEEFLHKLTQQRQSDPVSGPEYSKKNELSSTIISTCAINLKRQSDGPLGYATAKRPAGITPRIQTQASFYKKQPGRSLPTAYVQPIQELSGGTTAAKHPTRVVGEASTGTGHGERVERVVNGAAGAAAPAGSELPRGAGAAGAASCSCSGDSRRPLRTLGAAPRAEFKLQQQAFEFLDRQGEPWAQHLRVFGTELSGDGKRRFLVTTPARLWAEDVEPAALGSCHLYEIIRQGAPCHLYFDLEFIPEFNPGLCGDSLVDQLVGLVAEELAEAFGIAMPLQRQPPPPPDRRNSLMEQQQQQEWGPSVQRGPEHPLRLDLVRPQEGPGASGGAGAGGSEVSSADRAWEQGHAAEADAPQAGVASHGLGPAGGADRGSDVQPQGQDSAPGSCSFVSDGSCPWVWELCSTTAAKFSRHLIIRIPHCAFKDNFHVNAFVRRLFDRIATDPARFAAFFVRRSLDPNDPPTLFIDPAVYTRNRAFRLYLSSKAGKTAVLHATRRYAVASLLRRRGSEPTLHAGPAAATTRGAGTGAESRSRSPHDQPPTAPDATAAVAQHPRSEACAARGTGSTSAATAAGCAPMSSTAALQAPGGSSAARSTDGGGVLVPPRVEAAVAREVFLATLVTCVGRVDRMLTLYDDGSGGGGRGGGAGGGGAAALAGFHSTADMAGAGAGAQRAHVSLPTGIPRLPIPAGGRRDATGGRSLGPVSGPQQLQGAVAAPFQYGPSPFPRIDEFIESVCCEGGVQGRIRCWQHLPGSLLLLSMRNNRWCANVGRPHRSNGIFYQVDLREGTWCQRCYDPDCRDFRSARMPLPARLWEDCCSAQASCLRSGQQSAAQPAGQAVQDPQGASQPQPQHHHHHQQRADGQTALLGPGGVDQEGDEDDDPEFDLMCAKALEEFEQRMASHPIVG